MLFGGSKESKEEKQARKEEALLNRFGLTGLSDPQNIESVKTIANELAGTGLMEFGATLGGASEKDMIKIQMYYQRAMIEQSWIIIRQLDTLTKLLRDRE